MTKAPFQDSFSQTAGTKRPGQVNLAEDIAWAVHNLLNRSPTPSTEEMIKRWDFDFKG
jgi:hypothetical protein